LSYLLDTNVVSEWVKPEPARTVVEWLAQVDEDEVFLSVISIAELRRGVELLDTGRRRQRLEKWLSEDLTDRFQPRILPIDLVVADAWGRITARATRAGRTVGSMDGFVAATADAHGLTLATRNTRDFDRLGVSLFNPWEPQ
jgi:predicted nucleic acid-binding protein